MAWWRVDPQRPKQVIHSKSPGSRQARPLPLASGDSNHTNNSDTTLVQWFHRWGLEMIVWACFHIPGWRGHKGQAPSNQVADYRHQRGTDITVTTVTSWDSGDQVNHQKWTIAESSRKQIWHILKWYSANKQPAESQHSQYHQHNPHSSGFVSAFGAFLHC